MMKNYLFFLFYLSIYFVQAQPGALDLSFGTGGKILTDLGNSSDWGKAVVIQHDGKIVVAGITGSGVFGDFALVRYNGDGSMDSTFGLAGKVITDFDTSWEEAWAATIQSDGKIIVAGSSANDKPWDFALARYNTNGSLDNTFGAGGLVTTDFGNSYDLGVSVVMQLDGKIILAGRSDSGPNFDFALVRYNSNGNLDSTYGTYGKVLTDFGGQYDIGWSVAIQNDGKVVVAGNSDAGSTNQVDMALARYNTDGSLDNSFGSGGKVFYNFGYFNLTCYSVIVQNDNKILVGGASAATPSGSDFILARYNSNGIIDSLFGLNGKVTTDLGGVFERGIQLGLQADGRIVMAGLSGNSSFYDFALVRYNNDGSLDTNFDSDGKVVTSFGTNSSAYSIAMQDNGKIVVAGDCNYDFAVARYIGCFDINSKGGRTPCDNYATDIVERPEMVGIIIHPNPSSGIFVIELQSITVATQICVYDLLGNCMLNINYRNDSSPIIDLSNQPKGIYIMEIMSEGIRYVNKIVVQ
jgi:uncharacterized delta-60 repeat protein